MKLARISITVPHDVLAAADRQAKGPNRSRSWVVAEALRQWVETPAERFRRAEVIRGLRSASLE